ncbi:MAG: hypothetical protein AB1646_20125 [Thermodesulfobacteriota bacterium]
MQKIRHSGVLLAITLLIGFTVTSVSARAESNQDLPPIYLGMERGPDGKVEVKFVYSKRSGGTQRFEPTHGYLIKPNPAQRDCNIQNAKNLKISAEHAAKPLYDSADPQSRVPTEKIPTFFAIVVSWELARLKLVKIKEEALPYHTCTRRLWEKLLGVGTGGR